MAPVPIGARGWAANLSRIASGFGLGVATVGFHRAVDGHVTAASRCAHLVPFRILSAIRVNRLRSAGGFEVAKLAGREKDTGPLEAIPAREMRGWDAIGVVLAGEEKGGRRFQLANEDAFGSARAKILGIVGTGIAGVAEEVSIGVGLIGIGHVRME